MVPYSKLKILHQLTYAPESFINTSVLTVHMSSYIGSTCRNLQIRISEHKGISYRTNMNITKPSFSRIRDHALECKHPISEQGFVIRYRAKNAADLRIAECLSVMKERPELNGTELAARLLIFS